MFFPFVLPVSASGWEAPPGSRARLQPLLFSRVKLKSCGLLWHKIRRGNNFFSSRTPRSTPVAPHELGKILPCRKEEKLKPLSRRTFFSCPCISLFSFLFFFARQPKLTGSSKYCDLWSQLRRRFPRAAPVLAPRLLLARPPRTLPSTSPELRGGHSG